MEDFINISQYDGRYWS